MWETSQLKFLYFKSDGQIYYQYMSYDKLFHLLQCKADLFDWIDLKVNLLNPNK